MNNDNLMPIPQNFKNNVEWILGAYTDAGVSFTNGFQKDAIQNAVGARKHNKWKDWACDISYIENSKGRFVIVEDFGTMGLTGENKHCDEINAMMARGEILPPEERLARFTSMFNSGGNTTGGGLFGAGKSVYSVASEEYTYYFDSFSANKEEATDIIEGIIRSFERRKENNAYLSVSSLSIGMCISTPKDSYGDVLQKADKALYHMKQSGKAGYYFYTNMLNGSGHKSSIDLDRLVNNLEKQGAYTGSLSVEYREFAKIYDFIRHLVERYDHNMQLIMFTLEPVKEEKFDIDEQENAMNCMENAIKSSLRTVDVSTRFSSKQFLVVLLNAQKEDVDTITNRIFDKFYKTYDSKLIDLNYDIADLLKIEQRKTEK